MVDQFNLCPVEEELCFARGDTVVWERVIKDADSVVVDITGFTYTLSVDTLLDPPDATTLIFSIDSSIPIGTDGRALFQFSVANWTAFTAAMGNPPATAFYDLEQLDGSANKRTVRKGAFVVTQDIGK